MRYVNKKAINLVALVLVTAGLFGTLPGLYYGASSHGSVPIRELPSASAVSKPKIPLVTGQPIAIDIPSVRINIPVINGYYSPHTKGWTLSLDKAQFATPTVWPNNISGNTFIYGHYRVGVFYNLPKIQPGAEAFITTANGYKFKYKFYSTYATQPTDASVLHYQGSPMLTLQTCSGAWYQNRQMYLFHYEGYDKLPN